MLPSRSPHVDDLRERFAAGGQDHVFRFWDRLDAASRERLAAQAAGVDLALVARALDIARPAPRPNSGRLAPPPVVRLPEHGGDAAAWCAAGRRGEEILADGGVGILVVAGGQGTRLGFAGPKGAFPIGPVTDRSLFALYAQRLLRLRARFGVRIPWYVMTSATTDAQTRALFAAERSFGLPAEDVFFFQQRMVPAVDFEGRLLLDRPDHLFESPDGHGGVVPALAASGALGDLAGRGCTRLFSWQIDNPLVRIAEAVYLGLHAAAGADVSCKVVARREALEKVGHVVVRDGRIGIVEYSEIDPADRDARDARGDFVLWAGGISIYVWEADFLRRLADDADRMLPFHASAKKIPVVDDAGRTTTPAAPNGWKLERFVFDGLPFASRVAVVETGRDEYSPLKNERGGESPETVRRDLSALYRRWLVEAGVEPPPPGARIEIDHAAFDGPEDIRARGLTRVAQASDAIRIASGATA